MSGVPVDNSPGSFAHYNAFMPLRHLNLLDSQACIQAGLSFQQCVLVRVRGLPFFHCSFTGEKSMQFDYTKTLVLVKGGLLDHENTWKTYLENCPDWQQTALVLTGPLFLASVLLTHILSRLTGGYAMYLYGSNWLMALISGLVMGAIGFFIVVLVFNYLAGVFKGTPNFSRAFAAVSLAMIPAWVAGPIGALIPYIGFLVTLAGGILTLVFLYRITPMALHVADDKRVVHFVVSLVTVIVINMIIGVMFGLGSVAGPQSSIG